MSGPGLYTPPIPMVPNDISGVKDQPRLILENLREFVRRTHKMDGRFISYTSMPQAAGGESKIRVLDR
jgi:hypothetical protein